MINYQKFSVEKSTHKKRDRLGGNAKHTDCACAGSHLILMNEMIVFRRNGIKSFTRNWNFKPKMYYLQDKYCYGITNKICTYIICISIIMKWYFVIKICL